MKKKFKCFFDSQVLRINCILVSLEKQQRDSEVKGRTNSAHGSRISEIFNKTSMHKHQDSVQHLRVQSRIYPWNDISSNLWYLHVVCKVSIPRNFQWNKNALTLGFRSMVMPAKSYLCLKRYVKLFLIFARCLQIVRYLKMSMKIKMHK